MPIITSEIKEFVFDDLKVMEEHFKNEKQAVKYLPISEFVNRNSIFMEDEFYGRGTNWVSFNKEGFISFCNLIDIPQAFISDIKKEGLCSEVINNYITNENVNKKLMNNRFVVDTSDKKTVLGVVSNTYREYSNFKLLNDIKSKLKTLSGEFKIEKSYEINTRLYFRLLSEDIKSSNITDLLGTVDDISQVGLQICNSMIGNSSVSISYFIKRLICANGLIVETSNTSKRVIHSGNSYTFAERLDKATSSAIEGINSVVDMIEALTGIPFKPKKLVDAGGADLVYNIISLKDYEIEKRKKLKGDLQLEYDKDLISRYPTEYAGELSSQVFNSPYRDNPTMFDFINVFTEYAQNKDINIERRIDIERKTGGLVSWIIGNMGKLM